MINHNATVAGSDLRIEESAYAQIRDLTLANGEKLPTLDAYLEQGAKDASMKLICEIKTHSSAASNTRAVNAVVAAVKAKSMETRVDYIAFDYEAYSTWAATRLRPKSRRTSSRASTTSIRPCFRKNPSG